MGAPIFEAEVALECQNKLGEGIMWDDRTSLLHWVDIEKAEIHSWNLKSPKQEIQTLKERYVSALAPRKSGAGLVIALQNSIKINDESRVIAEPLNSPNVRFNDGACDALGRLFIGSMSLRNVIGEGTLWRIDPSGEATLVLEDVGTSNGIDWSPDDKLMYYVDSETGDVEVFDYDLDSGVPSNRRVFARRPEVLGGEGEAIGAFDGLVVDGVGNVWVARWGDSRVVVYSPGGEILAHIRTPGALSPTIPCFGGERLETLFIATANADIAGQGEMQGKYPNSGDVYRLDCAGTEVRKALGPEWKGRVRHRFGG